MGLFTILAEALRYPAPGQCARLEALYADLPDGNVKVHYGKFVDSIKKLNLGQWEELHTRTLDLDPPAAPYIGFQTWGDSYQRGTFMSMLNRAISQHEVDPEGELPDHLIPVLKLLDSQVSPLPEILEVMVPAVERIRAQLTKVDPTNPYVFILTAISIASADAASAIATSLSRN